MAEVPYVLEPHPFAVNAAANGYAPDDAGDYEVLLSGGGSAWLGADIMAPATLVDGRVFCVAGDTWRGGCNDDGSLSNSTRMARNTLVECREAGAVAWYGPGWGDAFAATEPGQWLWPASVVADELGYLIVLCMRVTRVAAGWGFAVTGYDLVRVDLRDMSVVSVSQAPCPQAQSTVWNGSMLVRGRWVYICGFRRTYPYGRQLLARTTFAKMASVWEYWAPGGWVQDFGAAGDVPVVNRPLRSLWCIEYAGGVLATSHIIDAYQAAEVKGWWAPEPWGPFQPLGEPVASFPAAEGWMNYAGRAVKVGSRIVAMSSTNTVPGAGAKVDVYRYGAHFKDAVVAFP